MHKPLLFFLLLCSTLHAQTLHYFFGNIHSHTSYSDGNKDSAVSGMTTPLQGFSYARQSSHIDFYGISEHNHASAGMPSPQYFRRGLNDANTATTDGQFVAMYGMEWGVISNGGHMIVYGFDSLCGWDFGTQEIYVPEGNYSKMFQTINRKQGSFGYMAHPQSGDYGNLFSQAYNASADNAVVGIAMRSGPAFSTNNTYSNPSSSSYISRYNDALKIGFHIGPGIDHDTHNSVFGRQSAGRLVVLAPILNRAEIYNAFRQRRFYASDDWNAELNFSIQGRPMGSRVTHAGNPTLEVAVNDPDGENVSSITVYGGVAGSGVAPAQVTQASNTNTLSFTPVINPNQEYYYYLYIIQTNGDKIWTAPIWYTRNDAYTIQAPVADFTAGVSVCSNNPKVFQDISLQSPDSWWWTAPGAYPESSSLQHPEFTFSTPGTYQVRLVVSNQAGSDTITKTITVQPPPVVSILSGDSICKGKSTTLTATGADSYIWSNAALSASITVSPQVSTTYTVTGFVNGCFDTALVSLTVYQSLPLPVVTKVADTLFSDAPYGNRWFYNTALIPGATSNFYVPLQTGYYQVQVTDSMGCKSEYSLPLGVTQGTGDGPGKEQNPFLLYPNPCSNKLFISCASAQRHVFFEVHTLTGYWVYGQELEECIPGKAVAIDLSELPPGMYIMTCKSRKDIVEYKVQKQ